MSADATACDWVFRHAGNCLIEFPDLQLGPCPPRCAPQAWVATLWPDPSQSGSWVSSCWEPAERGWHLPGHLVVGDVLQFGLAAFNACDGLPVHGWDLRWYGWLRYVTDVALVVAGPYRDADECAVGAANTVAELRLAQLVGPEIDPSWALGESADVDTEQ